MGGINFALIIVTFLNLVLGSVIYLRGRRSRATTWYSIAVFSVAWWAIAALFFRVAETESSAAFWYVNSFVAPALVIVAFLFFTLYFPYDKPRAGRKVRIGAAIGFFIVEAAIIAPGFITDVHILREPRSVDFGPWQVYLYALYTIAYLSWAFINIVATYRESPHSLRRNVLFIALGAAITAVVGISGGLLLPIAGDFNFIWAGPAATVFVFVFTGYAITRFQLLNVKVIAVEVMATLIELILIAEIFFSKGKFDFVFRIAIALLVGIFGFFLTRGVKKEVETRKEMEELTEELQRTNTELQKLDEAKSEFLSIASHQLRTPLTAIKGFISMILEGMYGKPEERERATLKKVYESNERLVKLVNDLLDISKIESGGFKYEWKGVDVPSLILGVINELERNAIMKGLYLRVEPAPTVTRITADPEKLRQVIINVIDNAIHYTDVGGITVRVRNEDDHVRIAIQDTGIGLEPHEIKELFRKYVRGRRGSRVREGTGLGLYVAKRIVEDHGGKIWVESPGKNRGSTFFVRLPVMRPSPSVIAE